MVDTPSPARPIPRRNLLLGGGAAVLAGGAGVTALRRRDRFAGGEISAPEALEAMRSGDLMLIDIRRPDEWARTGVAEGARTLDMRRPDFVEALTRMSGGDPDRRVGLICAAGVRSDRTAARLAEAGFTRVVDVSEGMEGSAAGPGWIARGLPVRRP